MIHIEISVEPHYKKCLWKEPMVFDPKTPPHVIISRTFETWESTRKFLVDDLRLKPVDEIDMCLINPEDQYVGAEISLKEQTGILYTHAVLAIEGSEKTSG